MTTTKTFDQKTIANALRIRERHRKAIAAEAILAKIVSSEEYVQAIAYYEAQELAKACGVTPKSKSKRLDKLTPKAPPPPDPHHIQELNDRIANATRRLDSATRWRVQISNKIDPRVSKKTGELIPCAFTDDDKALLEQQKKIAEMVEIEAGKELERLVKLHPMYQRWLKDVPGCTSGFATLGRLLGIVDFNKCTKPSALARFCGLGLERVGDKWVSQQRRKGETTVGEDGRPVRGKGQKITYVPELKSALYNWASTIKKAQGQKPGHKIQEGRYYKRFIEKKHGLTETRKDKSAGWIERTAERCATRLFLEDLYIVGRTMLGLPVWPEYHAARSGYAHGGVVCVNEPRMLTLDEAFRLVAGEDIGGVSSEEAAQ